MSVSVEALGERFPALVEGQEPPAIEYLAHVLEPAVLVRGETLLVHGQRTDTLHFVVSGALEVSIQAGGRTLVLGRRRAGSWVGELGFVSPAVASADVRVESDCEIWSLSHDALLAMGRRRPDMAAHLLGLVCEQLAQRLRETSAGLFRRDEDGRLHFEQVEAPQTILGHLARMLGIGSDA